ncbi:uncharacterized protein LOC117282517 [Cryptotermes secundus]|uniref:uncharacterized protein LOC117282517 n=1 Tax=Cryptotermes secundus TaxID=105785 RepID=UPI001454DBBF|nr:uncharacterized protein LOC117282517 [Cryptotermes secundus]
MSNWLPLKREATEYSSQYIQKDVMPLVEKVYAPETLSVCNCQDLGHNKQPPVLLDMNSSARYLDPYVSTTHFTNAKFSDDQIHGIARNDAVTFYTMDQIPQLSIHTQPLYDSVIFKNKISNRTLPQMVCRVPHKGLESEMQAKFVHPYQHKFSSKMWE